MPTPSNAQITIFGGSGFIGRQIVHVLARAGYRIKVPTRRPEQALAERTSGVVGQIVPFACDIHDASQVAAAVEGSFAVINLIGVLSETAQNSFEFLQAEFPGILAQQARLAGVQRFIQMSALGVRLDHPALYARTKAAGEQAVKNIYPDATILRPSIVFGGEDNFYNQFAQLALYSPVLPLIGNGVTRFQPVFVGDIAVAVLKILQTVTVTGQTYELAGPAIYSFRQIIEYIVATIHRPRILMRMPWPLAKLVAALMEILPKPMLTRDQVTLLQSGDNVLTGRYLTLNDLGITPTAVEAVVPDYLTVYRPGGKYAMR